eukprot:scaffold576_cov260-Pinguiococcus_pyrenoidosus.AAC.93
MRITRFRLTHADRLDGNLLVRCRVVLVILQAPSRSQEHSRPIELEALLRVSANVPNLRRHGARERRAL